MSIDPCHIANEIHWKARYPLTKNYTKGTNTTPLVTIIVLYNTIPV